MLTEFIFYRTSSALELICVTAVLPVKIKSFSTEAYIGSVVSYYISLISMYPFL